MSRRIFLDIETLPPVESVREKLARELFHKQELGEFAVNEAEAEGEAETRFRDLALRGEWGRLLCIGLLIEENGAIKHCGVLGRDRETRQFHLDEARTLRAFWKLVEGFREGRDLFIGHNLFDFDLLFLYKRSCIHQVKPSVNLSFRRYQPRPILDTMWEWTKWHHRISLHDLAQALGIQSSKEFGVNGQSVYELYQQGQHEEIARYCLRDVKCTHEAFYRMQYETALPFASFESPLAENVSAQAANPVMAIA